MRRFLVSRFLQALAVLWLVATLTFALMHMVPGGPFDRERRLPPEVLANIAAKYRLDDPLPVQYLRYLGDLLQGSLGLSYKYIDRTVNTIVAETLPVSALLGASAFLFAVTLAFLVQRRHAVSCSDRSDERREAWREEL